MNEQTNIKVKYFQITLLFDNILINQQEIDTLFRNQVKNDEDINKIQQYLCSIPYFQNLFREIHESLIPKLIRKFSYGKYESGQYIIENGNNIKDFFIILGGICLEMKKKKQEDVDGQQNNQIQEDINKTPFFKILKQSEERKKSLLFQQTQIFSSGRSQTLRHIEDVDQLEVVREQKYYRQSKTHLTIKQQLENLFIQQNKREYENKGFDILNTLKDGDFFGGIVKKGAEQSFSDIVCISEVEYVCLSYTDYEKILSSFQQKICEQKVEFLRQYRFLSIYTGHYLNKRLSMFEEIQLQRNNFLFEINSKPNYIYFIIEGEFILHKNIDFKQYLDNTQKQTENKKTQLQQDLSQEKNLLNEQTDIEDQISKNKTNSFHPFKRNTIISYLSPGNYIGLSEILTDQQYTYSVTCNSAQAKVYSLSKSNFEKFFQCDANIEIMAEDILRKEKIYDDVLSSNVKMMKKQYTKFEQHNNNKNMLKIFESNQKRNSSCVNTFVPISVVLDRQSEQYERLSSLDQKSKRQYKRKNPIMKEKEQEASKNIQNLITNSINKDPYFRRKLLHSISSLGFKLNKDNCQIYNQLKSQNHISVNQTETLSNQLEQDQIQNSKMISSSNQSQSNDELDEIPEISQFCTQQQSQNYKFFNPAKQQELKRQRLSFVIGQQQLNKRLSLQAQSSQQSNDKPLFNMIKNSNKIEDIKYFENIKNDQNSDNQSQTLISVNKNINLDQSIEYQIQTNHSQTSTNLVNEKEQITSSSQVKQNSQEFAIEEEKNSSFAPESTQESMTNSATYIDSQYSSSPNKNQKYNSIKAQYLSRKNKTQDTLFNHKHSKTQISPRISFLKIEDEIDPIKEVPQVQSFFTQRQSLTNNQNKGNLQKDTDKNQKISIKSFSDLKQSQMYFSKQNQKNIQNSPQSEKSKMILYNSCLFQSTQEYPKTSKLLQKCLHTERMAQNNSQNSSKSQQIKSTSAYLKNTLEQDSNLFNSNISFIKDANITSHNKFQNTQRQIIKNKVYQLDSLISFSPQNPKQQSQTTCIGGTPKKINKQNKNPQNATEREKTCPNVMNRQNIKKYSCTEFSNSNGDIQTKDFQETNIGFYTPQKSPNFSKQDYSVNYKNSSFGQFSPSSTKISQYTKPQIPSISLYSSHINQNHKRTPSDLY